MCLRSCFGVCLFMICCCLIITEQSNFICSSQPIVALRGNDVILPCRLDPPVSASDKAVEWTKPGLDPAYIHLHQDGRLVYQSQNPLYNYRTRLFVEQMINGNVSLKLFSVKISDAGRYRCFLPSLWKDAFIQLNVGAVSPPIVRLAGIDKATSGVVLQCESKGWYPAPELIWLDGERKVLSAGPTETVRGPDGLYTVSSRVTVEKRHSNNVTCRVQQKDINQIRETQIHVPEDFFLAPCSCKAWISISVVAVLSLVAVILVVLWKWRQNRNNVVINKEDTTDRKEDTVKSKNTEGQSQTNRQSESKPLMTPQKETKKAPCMRPVEKETTNTSSQENQEIVADSRVIVDDVDPNGKFVRLRNKSTENQMLFSWTLEIKVNESIISYNFRGFSLDAQKMVTIWASDGGGNDNPPGDVVWKEQKSWGTADKVILRSPMKEIMDRWES